MIMLSRDLFGHLNESYSCFAALVNHTIFGTVSSTLMTACILIPPLRLPFSGRRATHFKISLNRLIVVLSNISICFFITSFIRLSDIKSPYSQSKSLYIPAKTAESLRLFASDNVLLYGRLSNLKYFVLTLKPIIAPKTSSKEEHFANTQDNMLIR